MAAATATAPAALPDLTTPFRRKDKVVAAEDMPGIRAISMRRDMVSVIVNTLLKNQMVFLVMLIGFSGTMFFGSIVNASLVNLAERQREVATFRALGYGPWRIGGLFFRESLLTNALGTLLGLPIGWVDGRAIG